MTSIRFSLATLLLVVLWIGAVMAVWTRRDAWYEIKREVRTVNYQSRYEDVRSIFEELSGLSPDGTRILAPDYPKYEAAEIFSNAHPEICLYKFHHAIGRGYGFLDDDTAIFEADYRTWSGHGREFSYYRRRFPEWWWGHFYRPEVWLFSVLSGMLVWRIGKAIRNKTRTPGSVRASAAAVHSPE